MNKKIYVDKHYRISRDLFERIQLASPNHLKTEIDKIEHYLSRGLMYDDRYKEQDKINAHVTKDIKYIKALLEQLFSNIAFSENSDTRRNKLLREFKNEFYKYKFLD